MNKGFNVYHNYCGRHDFTGHVITITDPAVIFMSELTRNSRKEYTHVHCRR